MRDGRFWIRAAVLLFGASWSACLGLVGLLAMTVWPERLGLARMPTASLGVAMVAASCFLFAATVADRVFPRADSRVTGAVQVLLWVVIVAGVTNSVRTML